MEVKVAEQKIPFFLLEVYRNAMTSPTLTAAGRKGPNSSKSATPAPSPLSM